MKVRKGYRLTTKYNPYHIELSNNYSLLEEFSNNPSQTHQTTSIERKFKLSAAIRCQEKKNNKISKQIIKNRDNDAEIINIAIELAHDERNVMNKPTIRQSAHVGKALITATQHRNNSITRDVKHVQFKSKPTIATYQQHNETTMLTYDSGSDGHYLRKKGQKKVRPADIENIRQESRSSQ